MKKKTLASLLILVMAWSLLSTGASAFIRRGTVHITADTESVSLAPGETKTVNIVIDPSQDDQMPGCGMADCPEACGANCLSKDGNCTCDITAYRTYYSEIKLKSSDSAVADAALNDDGTVTITAYSEGTAVINIAARLREYTGSSVDVAVEVTSPASAALSKGAVAAMIVGDALCIILMAVIVIKSRRDEHR